VSHLATASPLARGEVTLSGYLGNSGEVKYEHGSAGVNVAGNGTATTSLRTIHAVLGVGYTF